MFKKGMRDGILANQFNQVSLQSVFLLKYQSRYGKKKYFQAGEDNHVVCMG